jgi:hypothetical protein
MRVALLFCPTLLAAFCVVSRANAETMTIWVKAFIPNSGQTVIVSVPNHDHQTMLKGPGLIGCFLTDQRSFVADKSASARMTSVIKFDLTPNGIKNRSDNNYTGVTQQLACDSGSTAGQCTGRAPASQMSFSNVQYDADHQIFSATLNGLASNPCFTYSGINVAPNIHYSAQFSLNAKNRTWGLTAKIGQFPAFEAYLQVGTYPPIPMFQAQAQAFLGGLGIFNSRDELEVTGSY